MWRHPILALAGVAAIVAGCGKGGDIVDPSGNGQNTLDGIALTAQVVEVVHSATSVKQVSLHVTLTNTTNAAVVRSYPAGCPVLIRLYRVQDLALVYDEGQQPCGFTTPTDVRLEPGASATLTSGLRFPWTITGDSLSAGAYYAAALLRITGVNLIEVDAGIYSLPFCYETPAATVCE